jgi:hypothetical protein
MSLTARILLQVTVCSDFYEHPSKMRIPREPLKYGLAKSVVKWHGLPKGWVKVLVQMAFKYGQRLRPRN